MYTSCPLFVLLCSLEFGGNELLSKEIGQIEEEYFDNKFEVLKICDKSNLNFFIVCSEI